VTRFCRLAIERSNDDICSFPYPFCLTEIGSKESDRGLLTKGIQLFVWVTRGCPPLLTPHTMVRLFVNIGSVRLFFPVIQKQIKILLPSYAFVFSVIEKTDEDVPSELSDSVSFLSSNEI